MRILYVIAANPLSIKDSSQEYVRLNTLSSGYKNFKKKDVQNNLQTINSVGSLDIHYTVYVITNRRNLAALIKSYFNLSKIVKKENPQILHIFWLYAKMSG
jgi:hypothetical protein